MPPAVGSRMDDEADPAVGATRLGGVPVVFYTPTHHILSGCGCAWVAGLLGELPSSMDAAALHHLVHAGHLYHPFLTLSVAVWTYMFRSVA